MKRVLLSLDQFGYPLEFNFKGKGPKWPTVIGGCFNIIAKMAILAYVVYKMVLIHEHAQDTMLSSE